MDLSKLRLFSMVNKRLTWLNQRQNVLARNIANADTPSYRARDLKPQEFSRHLKPGNLNLQPTKTHDTHMVSAQKARPHRDAADRKNYEIALSGNAVVMDEQLMKVGETTMQHQLATNLYRKHVSMIKVALGRPSR